jgi:hypothetical protein
MSAAQAASATSAPDPLLPADGKPAQSAPALLVATQATELVLTSGQPQIAPVDGTSLLTMTNADHAVFIVADQRLLRAGLGSLVQSEQHERPVDLRARQCAAARLCPHLGA